MRLVVVAAYLPLALAVSIFTPIGEAPDELAHYQYVRLVQDERRLPRAADDFWQGHQAPLYYLAQAAWARGWEAVLGCRVALERLPSRPSHGFPVATELYLQHGPEERLCGWGCHELSFHLLRLLSIGLTLATIGVAFRLLDEVLPGAPAMATLGVAVVALLPSHVFASATLNNDALATLAIVTGTWAGVVAWRSGEARHLAGAWAAAALAMGAKLSAVFLFGLVAIVAVLRRDALRGLLEPRTRWWAALAAAATLVPVAVMGRNMLQWGDPFAAAALERCRELMLAAVPTLPVPTVAAYYLVELPEMLVRGMPVAYGAINFRGGPLLSHARWAVPLVGAGLLLSALPRGRRVWAGVARGPFVLLLVGLLCFLASYAYPGYRYRLLQPRFFLGQLPLAGVLAAVALTTFWRHVPWLGRRWPDGALPLAVAALVALNAAVLVTGVIGRLYGHAG